jgi:hypothetical protein
MLTGGLPRRDTLKLGAEVRYRLFPEIVGTGVGAVIAFCWGVTISGAVSGNRLLPSPHSRRVTAALSSRRAVSCCRRWRLAAPLPRSSWSAYEPATFCSGHTGRQGG